MLIFKKMESPEKQIINIYIDAHKNPKSEFEKWFVKALEMLNNEFENIQKSIY